MTSEIESNVIVCLCTALNDTSNEVRFFAAKSLGMIRSKNPIITESLRYTLETDEDGKVRKAAALSLEIIRKLDIMSENPKVIMNFNNPVHQAIGVNEETIIFSPQDTSKIVIDIRDLLDQIAQEKIRSNLSEDLVNQIVAAEVRKSPGLKKRLKAAIGYGGIEFVKTIFNHPIISVPIEMIKGFIEADQ
jgi:HEAT repeats